MKNSDLLEQGSEHYKKGSIQPIEFMFANNLGVEFCAGNVVKYITRFRYSSDPMNDLKKAQHYLNMLIEQWEDR